MTSGAKIIGQSTMSSSFAFSAHLGAAVISSASSVQPDALIVKTMGTLP